MKKLLLLFVLFISIQSFCQTPTKFYSYNEWLGAWGDSITNIALRDTLVAPYKIGETRFRIADSTVYIAVNISVRPYWMKLKGYIPTGIGTGTVTSVASSFTNGTVLSVAGSPITGSGTLNYTWNGAGTDVVLGNGSYTPYYSLITGVTNPLYSPIGHSHIASDISDFTTAGRSLLNGGSGISYNPSTGTISATLSGTGISSLNGLTDTSQTLAIDTTYTGATSWSSVGTAHTLRLPARLFDTLQIHSSAYNDSRFQLYSNLSTNTSLGTSNTLYPSQNAVKTYVDNGLATKLNKSDSTAGGYYPYSTNPKGYLVAADISGKLNRSDSTSPGFYPWSNPLGYISSEKNLGDNDLTQTSGDRYYHGNATNLGYAALTINDLSYFTIQGSLSPSDAMNYIQQGGEANPDNSMSIGHNSLISPYLNSRINFNEGFLTLGVSTGADGSGFNHGKLRMDTASIDFNLNPNSKKFRIYNLPNKSSLVSNDSVLIQDVNREMYKVPVSVFASAGDTTIYADTTFYQNITYSGKVRGNGYLITFDSSQMRFRDTATSATGALYGGIYDFNKGGVDLVTYDSVVNSNLLQNATAGIKLRVNDFNNLDTNNYIWVKPDLIEMSANKYKLLNVPTDITPNISYVYGQNASGELIKVAKDSVGGSSTPNLNAVTGVGNTSNQDINIFKTDGAFDINNIDDYAEAKLGLNDLVGFGGHRGYLYLSDLNNNGTYLTSTATTSAQMLHLPDSNGDTLATMAYARSVGGGGTPTDTTSLSNRINQKQDLLTYGTPGQIMEVNGTGDGYVWGDQNTLTDVLYDDPTHSLTFQRQGLTDITRVLPIVTTTNAGLMSAADKALLDSFAANRQYFDFDSTYHPLGGFSNDSTVKIKSFSLKAGSNVSLDSTINDNVIEYTVNATGGAGSSTGIDSSLAQNQPLSADRAIQGASHKLELGTSGSKLAGLDINSNKYSNFNTAIQYSTATATDANYSLDSATAVLILPTITANRTLTLPANGSGRSIQIINQNNSAFQWTVTLVNSIGVAVQTIPNGYKGKLINNGTSWVIDTYQEMDDVSFTLAYLGAGTKAHTVGLTLQTTTAATNITDGQLRVVAVPVMGDTTIRGLSVYMVTQGAYNADNENKVALFSVNPSTGACTQIAVSANDTAMWKNTSANNMLNVNFSTPVHVSRGVYYAAILWNAASTTTTPQVKVGATASNNAVYTNGGNLPNSIKLNGTINTQNTMPSSFNMSSVSTNTIMPYVELY